MSSKLMIVLMKYSSKLNTIPQPSQACRSKPCPDNSPRWRSSLVRSSRCEDRYPIILKLSRVPPSSCIQPPTMLWVTTATPSLMVMMQSRVRFQHSNTEFVSSMGRLLIKEITATNSSIIELTITKFKSRRRQMTSMHFPIELKIKFSRPIIRMSACETVVLVCWNGLYIICRIICAVKRHIWVCSYINKQLS